MTQASKVHLLRGIVAAAAINWLLPTAAQGEGLGQGQGLSDFLSAEERRLCELSRSADSTREEIDAALADIDRMARVAQGQVRFIEMETAWLAAAIARTFSDVYQDVHADEISFADTAKLGGTAASLSLVVSANQPFYDQLYGNLQGSDPSDEELAQAAIVTTSVGDATKVLGAALLEVLQIPFARIQQGPSAAFDAMLEKLDKETAVRVMEARALDIGLVASYRQDLPAAKAAMAAVEAFREQAKGCLDSWPPTPTTASTQPPASGANCLPKADLWFMHPDPQCGDPRDRFKMTVITGQGDIVEYVEGCATATYSNRSFIDLQLNIAFSTAYLSSDKEFQQPDGSFKAQLTVRGQEGEPSGFVVGYHATFPCGAGGLPSAFRFECFAPDPQWKKAEGFDAAFGEGATVACQHAIPRDEKNFKWND